MSVSFCLPHPVAMSDFIICGSFCVCVVVCHDQVRRQVSQGSRCRGSYTHESIPSDSAIDPLVTSQSGVCCKRTSVSHIVVKLHRLYRCRLVLRSPYACNPTVDGSVLIVGVRECIVGFGSVSAPRPILGVGAPSVLCCCLGAEYQSLPHVCADSEGFPSCLRRV